MDWAEKSYSWFFQLLCGPAFWLALIMNLLRNSSWTAEPFLTFALCLQGSEKLHFGIVVIDKHIQRSFNGDSFCLPWTVTVVTKTVEQGCVHPNGDGLCFSCLWSCHPDHLISAVGSAVFWGVRTICSATGSFTIGFGFTFAFLCSASFFWTNPVASIFPLRLNPPPWLFILR